MFKKVFDRFDDFDFEKMKTVVELVWDNRERIMDIIERLPQMLEETGDNIESAGSSAIRASAVLTGGQNGKGGATMLSKTAANALDRMETELGEAAEIMADVGREIDRIRIPSFRPKRTEVMGINVISGFDIDEHPMVDNAAKRLKEGSQRMTEIAKDLKLVAENLRDLGSSLTETGDDLNNVGNKLVKSGQTLRGFSGWTSS